MYVCILVMINDLVDTDLILNDKVWKYYQHFLQ